MAFVQLRRRDVDLVRHRVIERKRIGVILAAAGDGSRFGGPLPKQFVELRGKPLFLYSLEEFDRSPIVDVVVVSVAADRIETVESVLRRHGIAKVQKVTAGGSQRQHSVYNALSRMVSQGVDIVLVHDAARPFVTSALIESVARKAIQTGAAIPALPLRDTVKLVNPSAEIIRTLDRETLFSAQTPQGFSSKIITEAFEKALADKFVGTDEAALVERIGTPVSIVKGDPNNFKITARVDLTFAEAFLQQSTKID